MEFRTPTELLSEIKQTTQESEVALSKRIGISQPTINRILGGQRGCSLSSLRAIERVHAEVCGAPKTKTRKVLAAA
ncbi:helix-turn-helix transcriptional regulator [Burkholderia orbicola]|uniref:helix-turn-helix domain-containing protein n=1 Tax=Burkholderia orbicola TaxID=2978683 RepID=UPI002FE16A42